MGKKEEEHAIDAQLTKLLTSQRGYSELNVALLREGREMKMRRWMRAMFVREGVGFTRKLEK